MKLKAETKFDASDDGRIYYGTGDTLEEARHEIMSQVRDDELVMHVENVDTGEVIFDPTIGIYAD